MFNNRNNNFDSSFINEILFKLREGLKRELTDIEVKTFSMKRSGMAYEMIVDYINDERKSKEDIEFYVKSVVDEYAT